MTPVVLAVRQARPAVVSIRGQKTVLEPVSSTDSDEESEAPRQVNGMGTGTIIDERGYILTNYHVVSDVRRIEVTLDDGRGCVAELVAYDAAADLAVIKIPAPKPLTVIRIGTSSDLMVGESVIALGNAFGYEQTVTRGVISALGRDVQVSDTQSYDDLIQTDASINPGNSGGPLLNIDGEMIGVNVAVRAGAQGIGFAIPIDNALNVAAKLLNVQRLAQPMARPRDAGRGRPRRAAARDEGRRRPARPRRSAFNRATRSCASARSRLSRPLDLERALLGSRGRRTGGRRSATRRPDVLAWTSRWPNRPCKPVSAPPALAGDDARVWDVFGLNLTEEPHSTFERRNTRYRGGMHVERRAARTARPPRKASCPATSWSACTNGKRPPTRTSSTSSRGPTSTRLGKLKFYVLRGQNTLYGHLNVAAKPDGSDQATLRH